MRTIGQVHEINLEVEDVLDKIIKINNASNAIFNKLKRQMKKSRLALLPPVNGLAVSSHDYLSSHEFASNMAIF